MLGSNPSPGRIVILNGAPRAGKSSIVRVIQETFDGPWMNLGVDAHIGMTPPRYRPGIGLRPGGERPDLEDLIPAFYGALYESIAAHSRQGLNVAVDVGHHDAYSRPLYLLAKCARRLAGLPAFLVGVRCDLPTILERRAASMAGAYATGSEDDPIPEQVRLWQSAAHQPGVYDLEVDTSISTPEACAAAIRERLHGPPPMALRRLAAMTMDEREGG
jgi:chloramphenicol 3-O phosphotransferase